jgi:hypothetical protein
MAIEDFFPIIDPALANIDKKERWKLAKPHPAWRPDVRSDYDRQRLWKEIPAQERISLSYELGSRKERT